MRKGEHMTEEKQEKFETEENEAQIDPMMVEMAMEKFRSEQNLTGGVFAGLVGALAGAVIWAMITVFTKYQIGWMAVGVGFLVGIAIRTIGKGMDKVFGIVGAAMALLGCLLGNLFTVCYFVSVAEKMDFFDVLARLNLTVIANLLRATFNPMDLLFYAIAVYEGYRLSFRKIPEEEFLLMVKGSPSLIEST
jgi:hypothetical protein